MFELRPMTSTHGRHAPLERAASLAMLEWLVSSAKEHRMLTEYIRAAMRRAKYEILPDDGTFYGEIPDLDGVYANAETRRPLG